MSVVLYERERGIVKVSALQVKNEETKKFDYVINGLVNGELIETKTVEGGYRPQAGEARKMFKEMCEQYNPPVEAKAKATSTRQAKLYTAVDRDKEIARLQKRIEYLQAIEVVDAYPEAPATEADVPAEIPAE